MVNETVANLLISPARNRIEVLGLISHEPSPGRPQAPLPSFPAWWPRRKCGAFFCCVAGPVEIGGTCEGFPHYYCIRSNIGNPPMKPDTPPTWRYFGPRPPVCQRCGVPTTIKSKRTAHEFVYSCVWCGTEAIDRIADRIGASTASDPSSNR
jgi:hypothetical protein